MVSVLNVHTTPKKYSKLLYVNDLNILESLVMLLPPRAVYLGHISYFKVIRKKPYNEYRFNVMSTFAKI